MVKRTSRKYSRKNYKKKYSRKTLKRKYSRKNRKRTKKRQINKKNNFMKGGNFKRRLGVSNKIFGEEWYGEDNLKSS